VVKDVKRKIIHKEVSIIQLVNRPHIQVSGTIAADKTATATNNPLKSRKSIITKITRSDSAFEKFGILF